MSLASDATALRVEGYVTKRGVLSEQCCSALRRDALERLAIQNDIKLWSLDWWHYQAVRFGLLPTNANVVRVYHSPRARHIVLPFETPSLREARCRGAVPRALIVENGPNTPVTTEA